MSLSYIFMIALLAINFHSYSMDESDAESASIFRTPFFGSPTLECSMCPEQFFHEDSGIQHVIDRHSNDFFTTPKTNGFIHPDQAKKFLLSLKELDEEDEVASPFPIPTIPSPLSPRTTTSTPTSSSPLTVRLKNNNSENHRSKKPTAKKEVTKEINNKPGNFQCVCGERFKTQYTNHVIFGHFLKNERIPQPNTARCGTPYICRNCHKEFNDRTGYQEHKRIYRGHKISVRPEVIEAAKKLLTKVVKNAAKTSSDEESDSADSLTTRPPSPSSPIISKPIQENKSRPHEEKKADDRPFSCSKCYQGFRNSYQVSAHAVTVHIRRGEGFDTSQIINYAKPYVCSGCNKRFEYRNKSNRHRREHRPPSSISIDPLIHLLAQKFIVQKQQSSLIASVYSSDSEAYSDQDQHSSSSQSSSGMKKRKSAIESPSPNSKKRKTALMLSAIAKTQRTLPSSEIIQ